jgi:protein-S-isoprenylcysteine O-methyltransferase Ste14
MRSPSDPSERTGVRLPPMLFYALGTLAGWALGRGWPLPIPGGELVPVVGMLWIAAGSALAAWGIVAFRRSDTTFNPFGGTTAIVAAGPYRYTRNPMYLGAACIQIGIGLLLREAWVCVMLLPVLVIVDRHVIRREEAYLERKYGDAWKDYARRVRRWL